MTPSYSRELNDTRSRRKVVALPARVQAVDYHTGRVLAYFTGETLEEAWEAARRWEGFSLRPVNLLPIPRIELNRGPS